MDRQIDSRYIDIYNIRTIQILIGEDGGQTKYLDNLGDSVVSVVVDGLPVKVPLLPELLGE